MHILGIAKGKVILPDLTVLTFNEDALGHLFYDPKLKDMADLAEILEADMALTYASVAVATAMIACVTTTAAYMSIHSATPGTTGASEIAANSATGYTQAARPAITWAAYGSAAQVSNDTQTYTMGASWTPGPIPYFGLWTASSSGTWLFGGPTSGLSGNIPVGANVTFTSSVTLTASA
jgi:hypothetical protein